MIKKYGFVYAVKYYRIPQLTLLAIVFALSKDYILLLTTTAFEIRERSALYTLYDTIINYSLIALWIYSFVSVIRARSYRYKTGRNYYNDQSKYKRSYFSLLEYFSDAEPHKLDTTQFKACSWRQSRGLVFGTVEKRLIRIPSNSECNITVAGPPGSAKTAGIAIPNAITFGGSVLAVDIKGDIYNYVSKNTNRKIIRFCPDSPNAIQESIHFDPFGNLNSMNETEKKLYIESMATVLIADEGGSSSEGNYFTSRGRKMFQGIVFLLLAENPNINFPDVIHAILKGNIFDWVTRTLESDCAPAKEYLASFYQNSEKNITSAYDALCTSLVRYSNPLLDELLSNKGNCLSVETLEKGYDVYLQISQEHLDSYASLFTLILESISTGLKKRPDSSTGEKNRPILMILDEFPQLTFSYSLINSNLSTLRSKSVIIMLIMQNLSQLEHRYESTGARSIIGNCNYQIILGCNDINSAKVYSDMFGTKKVLKISTSETSSQNTSSGRSIQEANEKVYPPEYFGDLPSQNKMVLYFRGKYCECTKLNCYKN